MQRLKRMLIAQSLSVPGMVINYVALLFLIGVFHFSGFWVLSGVLVADIIGLSFNSYMVDWNVKIAMRFKSYRDFIKRIS